MPYIAVKSTCRSCGAFYAPGCVLKKKGVCLFCGEKRIKPNITPNNGELIDEIRLLLIDSIDNPCGGLFAAEIQRGLIARGIDVSVQKIINLVRWRGVNIKIHPISVGSMWVNLYTTSPPINFNKGGSS